MQITSTCYKRLKIIFISSTKFENTSNLLLRTISIYKFPRIKNACSEISNPSKTLLSNTATYRTSDVNLATHINIILSLKPKLSFITLEKMYAFGCGGVSGLF